MGITFTSSLYKMQGLNRWESTCNRTFRFFLVIYREYLIQHYPKHECLSKIQDLETDLKFHSALRYNMLLIYSAYHVKYYSILHKWFKDIWLLIFLLLIFTILSYFWHFFFLSKICLPSTCTQMTNILLRVNWLSIL